MNSDDRIRRAFDDLERRSQRVDPQPALQRLSRSEPAPSRRWTWALAGAALVLAVVGSVALFGLLPGTPDDDREFVDTTTTIDSVPADSTTTTKAPPSTSTTTPPAMEAAWFRVNRDLVEADVDDPFLNVRVDPSPSAPLVAKLPPTYAGIRWTGAEEVSDDGGTWYQVVLTDPVEILDYRGNDPLGYVNAAFLEPAVEGLPITSAELTPCTGADQFGGGDSRTIAHIGSLRVAEVSPTCTRIVMGFVEGAAAFGWDTIPAGTAPASALPEWFGAQAPWPLIIDLPTTTSVWPGASDVEGAYVVRNPDRSLSLIVMRPANRTRVRAVPDRGLLVIDLSGGDQVVPPTGNNVVLTSNPGVFAGTVAVTGIARPFEGNLGVAVLDSSNTPVTAVFSGSPSLGTIETDFYAVQTGDWLEAWGRFAVRVEGLAPGDYTLALSPGQGADEPLVTEIPFSVEASGQVAAAPSAGANEIAGRLIAFALGSPEAAPLADEVLIRLGNAETVIRTATQLADRSAWVVDADDFNAYVGPFDLLEIIANRPHVEVSEGPIPHCAAPPIDWWPGADLALPQINIEPIGIDSCLQWYAISLRVNASDEIQEIVLDLWEP